MMALVWAVLIHTLPRPKLQELRHSLKQVPTFPTWVSTLLVDSLPQALTMVPKL